MLTKRSDLLDIIKGLMIVFIIITHFHFVYPDDYRKYGFFYWIDMAVPVFMIITGYLNSLHFERFTSIKETYQPGIIVKKILRFLIPWLLVVIAEIPFLIFIRKYSILEIAIKICVGGGTAQVHTIHL